MKTKTRNGKIECKRKNGQIVLAGYSPINEFEQPCVFPFIYKGKEYSSCTFDPREDPKTGELIDVDEPWCATLVNDEGKMVRSGICEVSANTINVDKSECPVPPRTCGLPVRTKNTKDSIPKNFDIFDTDILQMPWMVTIGKYTKIQNGKLSNNCKLFLEITN